MVELKDTTLYRPAPSSVSEDVEFSKKRVVHCEGRQSAVTKDLFTDMGPFRILGRLFLLQRAWLWHSPGFGKRANPPPPRGSSMSGKRTLVDLFPLFGRTVMHPGHNTCQYYASAALNIARTEKRRMSHYRETRAL